MAKIRSSPIENRARKPYMLLNKKAPKQNAAPINVVVERSCKRIACLVQENKEKSNYISVGYIHSYIIQYFFISKLYPKTYH